MLKFAPPEDLNPPLIQHSFGRLQTEQGEALARLGAVEILRLSGRGERDLELEARVLDVKVRPYEVQLYYQPDEDWVLSGDCNCPAGSDCRHCAAAAFAWLAQRPDPVASEAQLRDWLEALKASEGTNQKILAARQEQILYLLARSERDELSLQVQPAIRTRRNGAKASSKAADAWRKPAPLFAGELLHHPLATGDDRELAGLLRSLQPGLLGARRGEASAVTLGQGAGDGIGALVLERLLATERLYWLDAWGKLTADPLSSGELRRVQLDWQSVPGGQQLQARLEPPAHGLFRLGERMLYVDAEHKLLGPVDLSPGKFALLSQAPVIPEAAVERVSRSLLEILPAPPLPKGSQLQETLIEDVRPVPVLTLQGPETEAAEAEDGAAPEIALHTALLQYDYAGKRLAPDPEGHPEATLLSGETVWRIGRDSEAEAKARRQLLATGLLPLEGSPGRFGFAHDGEPAGVAGPYLRNWHHWLHDSLSELRALGWHVDIEPSFRLAFLSSPAWRGELKPTADANVFDLALGVELHGEKVDLLPMLIRLLRTVPDPRAMRERLELHDTWLLPLDPHPIKVWAAKSRHESVPQRWLEVPAKRLARILDILIEIYDYLPGGEHEGAEPEHLSLSALNALQVRMHPNDYGVSWEAPPGLVEAAERLAGRPQDGVVDVEPPQGLQAELRPYQQRGLNWLQTLRSLGLNGILADEMGLGKTLQTLAHLLLEKEAGRLNAPALVVMPTSVLVTWQREAERFAPDLKVLMLHGPERVRELAALTGYDLILTSYGLLRDDALLHAHMQYAWVILDEAQLIKNPRSRTARLACRLQARHRLCLSGTPVENQLEELWSLFHFLMPGFLDTLERFNSRFRHPIERQGDLRRQAALRERVRPLMLRRRKLDVEAELPPKVEILRTVSFGSAQRDLYETLRLAVDKRVSGIIQEQGFRRARIVILDALLKLRQACCDPRLLPIPEAQKIRHSAKLELLMELLPELVAEGRRILIFSQFVSMLELIKARLGEAGLAHLELTGRTRKRQAVIDAFQAGQAPIFLISLKAGGLGLNLTAADTVIHYDPWWNPASEQQATDRAWRIGQTRPVFVYKLIAAGTVEESILNLQQSKQALREGLFEADPTASLETESLLALLRSGFEPGS